MYLSRERRCIGIVEASCQFIDHDFFQCAAGTISIALSLYSSELTFPACRDIGWFSCVTRVKKRSVTGSYPPCGRVHVILAFVNDNLKYLHGKLKKLMSIDAPCVPLPDGLYHHIARGHTGRQAAFHPGSLLPHHSGHALDFQLESHKWFHQTDR